VHAEVTWLEKLRFRGVADSGVPVTIDAAGTLGERPQGPGPMEMVLLALGGCTAIDVVLILEKMRVPLKGLRVVLDGDRAEDHPKVFSRVRLVYELAGDDLPEDKVRRALELTQEKYCSVLHMVNKTAEVSWEYRFR